MTGITSYRAYIPFYRLSRAEIAKAWGKAAVPGEKAVANHDEDSLTMAVAAAMDCAKGTDTSMVVERDPKAGYYKSCLNCGYVGYFRSQPLQ